jgi:hypothetical protein
MPLKNITDAMRDTEGKNGVQSPEIGMAILRAIRSGHRSMMLKGIAAAAAMPAMPASRVHRCIVSLVRSGLVEQDPMTSRDDLGPFALSLAGGGKPAEPRQAGPVGAGRWRQKHD